MLAWTFMRLNLLGLFGNLRSPMLPLSCEYHSHSCLLRVFVPIRDVRKLGVIKEEFALFSSEHMNYQINRCQRRGFISKLYSYISSYSSSLLEDLCAKYGFWVPDSRFLARYSGSTLIGRYRLPSSVRWVNSLLSLLISLVVFPLAFRYS